MLSSKLVVVLALVGRKSSAAGRMDADLFCCTHVGLVNAVTEEVLLAKSSRQAEAMNFVMVDSLGCVRLKIQEILLTQTTFAMTNRHRR